MARGGKLNMGAEFGIYADEILYQLSQLVFQTNIGT